MNENEMRDLFREMRDEPVPADSLARVRAGVEYKIHEKRRMPLWKMSAALAMAGCIVGAFLLLRPGKPAPSQHMSVPEIAQVLPPAESSVPVEPPVVRVTRPRRTRPQRIESVPVSIRIETPDPDVVILLVN